MDLFIKIAVAVTIIAIASYANIDVTWAWVSSWKAETVMIATAIASIVIAACALVATTVQGMQNRKHNRLSLRPFLVAVGDIDRKDNVVYFDFQLTNRGVGPAIIKEIELLFNDKVVSSNDYKSYNVFLRNEMRQFVDEKIGFIDCGDVMSVENKQRMWTLKYPDTKNNSDFVGKLSLRIKYQSIYKGKIFIYDSRDDIKAHDSGDKKIYPVPLAKTAQGLAHIHAACFTVFPLRAWSVDEFAELLKISTVFHIKHVHGFAIGQRLDAKQAELLNLAVVPKQQGKGFGRKLLTDFIAEVKKNGGQSIFLEVAENNTPALHLYEKAGFKKVGLRPRYYQVPDAPPVDAISMRLDIKTPLAKD